MTQFESRNDIRHAMQYRAFAINVLMSGRTGLTDEQRLSLATQALEQAQGLVSLAESMVDKSKAKLAEKAEKALTDAEFSALVADLEIPGDITQVLEYTDAKLTKMEEISLAKDAGVEIEADVPE